MMMTAKMALSSPIAMMKNKVKRENSVLKISWILLSFSVCPEVLPQTMKQIATYHKKKSTYKSNKR